MKSLISSWFITDTDVAFQREAGLADAQVGSRFVHATAVDARRIGAFVDICSRV